MPFGVFLYQLDNITGTTLAFWNNNNIYVTPEELLFQEGSYFISHQNGDFEMLVQRVQFHQKNFLLVGMIPIRWDYFIENKYLKTGFDGFPDLHKQYEIGSSNKSLPVLNGNGKELFRIQQKEGMSFIGYDSITLLLRTLAIILLFLFIHAIAEELVREKGFVKGFIWLVSVVFILRLLSYEFAFPFEFDKIALFDPSIYASNFIHRSLGDLLINAILMYWLARFYKHNNEGSSSYFDFIPEQIRFDLSNILLTVVGLQIGNIIKSLVQDSKISFDITNIPGLSIYTLVSFIILCFLVLFFFHISQLLLKPQVDKKNSIYRQLLVSAIAGIVYFFLFVNPQDTIINMSILIWILAYLGLLNFRKSDLGIPLLRSPFFIFWVMLFAMSVAAIVMYENKIVEHEQRKRIAEKLAIQTDPSGENLLNIAATNFDDGFLKNNYHRLLSEYSNKFIKDSLISENFSGYLNKYDTRIYTYDENYHPLFNDDSTSYAAIKTILLNKAKPTLISGLYSYEKVPDGISFLYQKEISDKFGVKGYLFVIINSKRYKSEALYPELFNQSQDLATDLNTNYAYAVYSNGKLINHFNNYNFPSSLEVKKFPGFEYTYKQNGDFSELWYNSGVGKLVLIVKRSVWMLESVTLFAYLFCSFLIIIFVFQGGSYLLTHRFQWSVLKNAFRFNIRTQIQATIIFLSVFSFIVIAIATISFFIIRYNRNNEERLSKSIQVMANEIDSRIRSQLVFDDVLTVSNMVSMDNLEKKIAEISDSHNVDINFYDTNGNLKISTQPYIYNKHLVSEKINPYAYFELHNNNSIRYIQSEEIGSFSYLSIYVPLTDEGGTVYAYLNIPYLNSQFELTQEISGFLATLINLNAFIFLVAGGIAFFLTNRITNSFSLIGQKMRQINIGKVNEEIIWNRNDEIGVLVTEYNKMVQKLESSASALAKSEREGAWREMARQVAHEIKNPLTPMKLSIQYLQKSIEAGSPNIKELSQKMAVTLIEQIDQLSKIAGDFSQFANIGNTKNEKFDINEVITSLVNLYKAYPNLQIEVGALGEASFINADKQQFNRLLTNLIKNAIEAGENRPNPVNIYINTQKEKDTVLIELIDQSGGISEVMAKQLFKPNFTTKTSGTGLGLAICKGIVEKSNGEIWFNTQLGVGTSFFIRLPLAD
ncbi:MAG: HAMP domain-containing sensor histidine kinase [Bacteroidetes bacterium]|nr:HAMP domain-containing sensor histidine kinase [Bacteroidota bacterium]